MINAIGIGRLLRELTLEHRRKIDLIKSAYSLLDKMVYNVFRALFYHLVFFYLLHSVRIKNSGEFATEVGWRASV